MRQMMSAALVLLMAMVPLAASADAPGVAVLYFDYDGPDAELSALRKGLAQMLVTDLKGTPDVQIVERERLQAVLDEIQLGKAKKLDAKTAARVGKLLGAKYLVLGGYFALAGTLRVDTRVVEVETGVVRASIGESGKTTDFMGIETRLAHKLMAELATLVNSNAAAKPLAAHEAVAVAPVAAYGRALEARDRGDKKTEKKELAAALKASPRFRHAKADLTRLNAAQ